MPVDLLGMSIVDEALPGHIPRFQGIPEPEEIEEDTYYSFFSSGLALLTDSDKVVRAVFFYRAGHEGFDAYPGPLPLNLEMGLTRPEVRTRCGVPAFAKPAADHPLLGHKGPVDRYDFDLYSVHLEYSAQSEEILVVTLMTPSSVPRDLGDTHEKL